MVNPPVEPMLAKLTEMLPEAGHFLYEPKWDGFRAIVFRTADDVLIQSRDLKPLDRYFPELHEALLQLRVDTVPNLGLHVRAMLRDQLELFIGSQGLRGIELDRRREVGVLVRDRSAIKRFKDVFEADWAGTKLAREEEKEAAA